MQKGTEPCSRFSYASMYVRIPQPPQLTNAICMNLCKQGWVGMDDYVKPRRGTAPSVYGTSSLVPPTAPPRHAAGLASLAPPVPNEVRLQELLGLQRRKLHTEPGPGTYEVSGCGEGGVWARGLGFVWRPRGGLGQVRGLGAGGWEGGDSS